MIENILILHPEKLNMKNNRKMKIKHFLLLAVMLICGSIAAQNNYNITTTNDPAHYYEGNTYVTAQIKIDGVEQTSDNMELGAYVRGEVRGSARIQLIGTNNQRYRVQIRVYGTAADDANQPIVFKLYDHSAGKEMTLYDVTYQGASAELLWVLRTTPGTSSKPYVLDFSSAIPLPITPYENAEGHDGWHLIASPLAGTGVAPTAVTNMTTGSYDLYYFDQTGGNNDMEWKNWKDGGEYSGFNLVPGKGYLYANSASVTLQFFGDLYSGDGEFDLEYVAGESCAHANLSGYNLMGNPFTTEAAVEDGNGAAKVFYRMNEAGSDLVSVASGSANGMEGIFVVAKSNTDKVKFNPGTKATRSIDQVNLNLVRNDNKTIDNVIVRFDGGEVLPKYAMHDDSPVIYVPQAGKDYSIVNASVTSVLPVNFKTSSFGTYTLRADIASAGVSYMHLIDRLTGEDIDMLLEGEYTFIGAPTDNADRFILRLTYSGNFDDENNIFAYQNGSDIVVCGDGTLQVFDVMGRFVSSQEIHGVQTIQALPMGVYIFRMVGEDIQTQKIYVR